MAALYIAAFRWLNTRTVLSGIFFGLCAVKPQLGVLVPFLLLAGRHYRVFASACITLLVLVALSLALYGTGTWAAYAHTLTGDAPGMLNATGYMHQFAAITIYSPFSTFYHSRIPGPVPAGEYDSAVQHRRMVYLANSTSATTAVVMSTLIIDEEIRTLSDASRAKQASESKHSASPHGANRTICQIHHTPMLHCTIILACRDRPRECARW